MALATLPEFKAAIGWTGDASQDAELQDFLDGATAVVEHITGPVISRAVVESHDGGGCQLTLRQRPHLVVASVTEYLPGGVTRALTVAATPAAATATSVTLDDATATLTRRGAGGAVTPFADGIENIVVSYTAGQATVPVNVKKAALVQASHMYQSTQLGGRPSFRGNATAGGPATGFGYGVPNAVREYLEPNQRLPGIG